MIETQILTDTPNGPTTRSVWVLLLNNSSVRKAEVVLKTDDDAATVINARADELFAQGEPVLDGLRAWYAYKQRMSDPFFNQLIFTLFVQLQNGADLPTLLAAANMVLDDDPGQKAIYQALNQALQTASESQFRQFVALALTVAYGKLGQR